ncbi:Ldh family oxidoreductase [Acidovorax sp.]|uniref:Ldh family oxidoreductase n=1 Tax=Acidovorax sp. TaxID=1872122 RepID=UPI003BB17B13
MLVPHEKAVAAAIEALENANVPSDHARLQVDLLVEADLRGRASHGLMRLPRIVERIGNGVTDPNTTGCIEWRGNVAFVDGQMGMGPIIACNAIDQLMQRVETAGVAVAAIRNSNHLGMLAWYAERVARQGKVLLAMCTSEALVHPWGGRHAMLGTNPLAIGVPAGKTPFVLDMATSLVSMGQIHDYALRNAPIPPSWALDAEGNATTDARLAKAGSIAPFGEAKGYALGIALEVLITALTASAVGRNVVGTLDSTQACNKGDVFIVIDPIAQPGVTESIERYLDDVRASGLVEKPVAVPGDRALATRAKRQRDGLELAEDVWARLQSLANQQPSNQSA